MSFCKLLIFVTFVNVVRCSYDEREALYLESKVGGWVIFDCPLEFPNDYPIPYHLHWRKENKLIFAWFGHDQQVSQQYAGRIHLIDSQIGLGKASINLTSVRESDTGWYECKMAYPNRSPSVPRNNGSWYHLSVDGSTLLKIPPVNQTVMEYEPAFFHCSVKNPDTMFVTWYKDNELLSSLHDLASRTVMAADGSVLITPTLMTDLGVYSCKVKNILGEEEYAQAFLNVQYKAKVIYAPKEVFFAYGHQAMLDCHFRSNPPLTNLRWDKDGFLFDPYNVKDVFYKRNGSLFFSEVDDLHAGKYSCTPFNELGSEGPSTSINVFVQHPPEFTLKPKTVSIQKLGDNVTLHCSAKDKHTDDDRSLIAWSKKDGLLPYQRYIVEGGNLTIFSLTANDRGMYTCSAINEAARIETDAEIMIETFSPKAPSNLTAVSTKTSITLKWIQNTIQPDMKFSIWYRPVDLQEWRTHQARVSSQYETTINNLESGREYEMMVLSQDRYNDGLFSRSFRYRTKAMDYEEPEEQASIAAFSQIGPPRNLSVELDGDEYVLKRENPDYGNEFLGLFVVRWFKEPEHTVQGKGETRSNYYSVSRNDLDSGVYTFQVSSQSTNNYEAFSDLCEISNPRNMVTIAIAVGAVSLMIVLCIVAVTLYLKRNLFSSYGREDKI